MSHAPIRRDRTAIRRVRCSKPIALALAEGIVSKPCTLLDYGCGHGADIRYLASRGIDAFGWDPHHRPDGERRDAAVVNLGYVLNVIEDTIERAETLRTAYALAQKVLVVAVRVDRSLDELEVCSDGLLTGRGTFQKLYSHDEFRAYVESTLGARMHTAALGIGYVFCDPAAEQRYLATKVFTRRLEYRTDLVAEFGKHPLAKRFVRLANVLGRVPKPEDFKSYENLVEHFGSPARIERLALAKIDLDAFAGSRAERRNDILVYLAALELQGVKPPPISALPSPLQSDVRAIWGSYARALEEGHAFLFTLGRPDMVKVACLASTVGKILPTDLYVHSSAQDALPALLRVILFAAKRIVGDLHYDVAKIATDGRAVAFLTYPAFDDVAHPALGRSVRVYLPKATYEVRDYSAYANPPILHRKDALVSPDYPLFADFRSLTEKEQALGLLSTHDIGFKASWDSLLSARGLVVEGHDIRRA